MTLHKSKISCGRRVTSNNTDSFPEAKRVESKWTGRKTGKDETQTGIRGKNTWITKFRMSRTQKLFSRERNTRIWKIFYFWYNNCFLSEEPIDRKKRMQNKTEAFILFFFFKKNDLRVWVWREKEEHWRRGLFVSYSPLFFALILLLLFMNLRLFFLPLAWNRGLSRMTVWHESSSWRRRDDSKLCSTDSSSCTHSMITDHQHHRHRCYQSDSDWLYLLNTVYLDAEKFCRKCLGWKGKEEDPGKRTCKSLRQREREAQILLPFLLLEAAFSLFF